jgi:hypothetical protein
MGEPVESVLLNTDAFVKNSRGFPALPAGAWEQGRLRVQHLISRKSGVLYWES